MGYLFDPRITNMEYYSSKDEIDTREVYHDRKPQRQYEIDIRSMSIEQPTKGRILQVLDTMKQETISTINVHLFAVGYVLYTMSNANGGIITNKHLDLCYNIIRDRCLDRDRDMVIRNIVKYTLYVRHVIGGL